MKKIQFFLVLGVLLALNFNAISQHDPFHPSMGFTVNVSSYCNCNPLNFNTNSCVRPTVIINPATSSCICPSFCYKYTICYDGNCYYKWAGTNTAVVISDTVSLLIGNNYSVEHCFTITQCGTQSGCGDMTCSGDPYYGPREDTICLYPNPTINLPDSICDSTQVCNLADHDYYYDWSFCGTPTGWHRYDSCFFPTTPCTYHVQVKDTNQCVSTWNMKVLPNYFVSDSIKVDTNNFCTQTKDSVIFTAYPHYGGNNPSYQWSLKHSGQIWNNAGTNNPIYKLINPLNGDKVKCEMTSNINKSCETNNPATSNTITMDVKPIPIITHQHPFVNVCTGDSAKLSLTATGDSISYQWHEDIYHDIPLYHLYNYILTGKTDSVCKIKPFQPAPHNIVFYYCVLTNSKGCQITSESVTLRINPRPEVSITPKSDTMCISSLQQVLLSATGSGISYKWSPSSSLIDTTGTTVRANPTSTTIYTVTGVNDYNCTTSDTATIYVSTPIQVDSSYITLLKNLGDPVTFTISPITSPPFKYQWLKDKIIITDATKSTYAISSIVCADTGMYTCKIMNKCDTVIAKKIFLGTTCSRYRYTLYGHVRYDNVDTTAVCGVEISLINSVGTVIDKTITDSTGFYVFMNLISGTYKLRCNVNYHAGGVNPTDALIANRNYIGMHHFTDTLKTRAADVNSDGIINPTDALIINRRYIGLLSHYPSPIPNKHSPEWYFTNYTSSPIKSLDSMVTIDGFNKVQNIRAICLGDDNASNDKVFQGGTIPNCFIPYNAIVANNSQILNPLLLASMTHVSLDSVTGKPSVYDTILMPLTVTNFNAAAFGYKVHFDSSKVQFVSLANINTAISNNGALLDTAVNGTIGIAFASNNQHSLHFTNNTKLFDIRLIYKGTANGMNDSTTLSFLPASEVTDSTLNEVNVIYQNGFIYPGYSISGTLVSNESCGGNPLAHDTLMLVTTAGVYANIPYTVTDTGGTFSFNLNNFYNVDSTRYRIQLKSGIGLDTTSRTISAWSTLTPVSLQIGNVFQVWAKNYGNIDTSVYCYAIDLHENVYVGCISQSQYYNYEINLIKYSADGTLKGVVNFVDTINYYDYWLGDMKTDNNGNIYLLGSIINVSGYVLIKCDSLGNIIWSINNLPTNEGWYSHFYFNPPTLGLDNVNNVYVTCPISDNVLSAKYNSDGILQWTNLHGNLNENYNFKMYIDRSGSMYVTSDFYNTNYNTNGMISYKFNTEGILQWSQIYNGGDSIQGFTFVDMKIDTSGNIYALGTNGWNFRNVIIKYNKNGVLQWIKELDNYFMVSLNLDNSANIYISSYVLDWYAFSILKFSNNGVYIGHTDLDYEYNMLLSQPYAPITQIDNNGNIYLSCTMYNSLNYISDISIIKYLPDLTKKWEAAYDVVYIPGNYLNVWNSGLIVSPNFNVYSWITQINIDSLSYENLNLKVTTIKYSECPETANLLRTFKNKPTTKKPVLSVKYPDVNVYPNPNDGSFTLEVSLPADGNVTLEAYNVIGENVLSEQHSMQKGVNKLKLKLNSNNKGIYFFNIITVSKTFNKKVIVE